MSSPVFHLYWTLDETQQEADNVQPAPTLIAPVDNFHAQGQPGPAFVWAFNGKLGKNDYFMFTIEHGAGVDVRCYKGTTGQARDYIPTLPFSDSSLPFKWQVAVVHADKPVNEGDACTGTNISLPSPVFHLYWALNAPPPDKNCCSKGGGEGCDQNC